MGKNWQNCLFIGCSVLLLLTLLNPQTASAHRMIIEHDKNGSIHVRYDDGTSAGVAYVTAYDADGEVVFEDEADDDGLLDYDKAVNVHRIVADDGMGHRATWTTGEEEASLLDEVPLFVRALFGISILVFFAAFFFLRTNKNSEEGE